jgi:uncharacterized membrane protein YoaK (UPF0700 family)
VRSVARALTRSSEELTSADDRTDEHAADRTGERAVARRFAPLLLWVVLAGVAGAVNAGAYLCCQRFVSHVTGTMTLLGLDFGAWTLVLDYAVVFACFVAGAAASVILIDVWFARSRHPWAVPVVGVVVILAAVAVAGEAGAFGAFGGSVEQPSDFLQLSLLSFSMGLMNSAVGRSAPGQRVTHLTGETTDLGMLVGAAFTRVGDERRAALADAALRAAKIFAFVLGAATMATVARRAGYLSFFAPATVAAAAVVFTVLGERRVVRVPARAAVPARARAAETSRARSQVSS